MTKETIASKLIKKYFLFETNYFGNQIIKNSIYSAPDFMIIGAAKAGTTSLFQYLAQHPEILSPKEKELEFFSIKFDKGIRWYLSNFPLKKHKKNSLTFEATPAYLFLKDAPCRIAKLFPLIKFIAILRDPVKRTYSNWAFRHNSSFVNSGEHARDARSFDVAVKEELQNPGLIDWRFAYINRSSYVNQLKRWYSYFPPEQILLLDSEDLKNKPVTSLKAVTNFLGISDFYTDFEKSNEKLTGLLGTKDSLKEKELKIYNANSYNQKIDDKIKKALEDYFKPYDKELEELTGRKFSWMK